MDEGAIGTRKKKTISYISGEKVVASVNDLILS